MPTYIAISDIAISIVLYCGVVLYTFEKCAARVQLFFSQCYKCYRKFMCTYVVYKEYELRINNITITIYIYSYIYSIAIYSYRYIYSMPYIAIAISDIAM